MNIKTALGSSVVTAMIVALVAAPETMAGTATNASGTICKNYDAADAALIEYLSRGTYSKKAARTRVICPLVRRTTNSLGAFAYVYIMHAVPEATTCTLYSYTVFGALLGTNTVSWTGLGPNAFVLNLAGAGKSNTWSDYTVFCEIPGNARATIYGVDLNEI